MLCYVMLCYVCLQRVNWKRLTFDEDINGVLSVATNSRLDFIAIRTV